MQRPDGLSRRDPTFRRLRCLVRLVEIREHEGVEFTVPALDPLDERIDDFQGETSLLAIKVAIQPAVICSKSFIKAPSLDRDASSRSDDVRRRHHRVSRRKIVPAARGWLDRLTTPARMRSEAANGTIWKI